MESFTIPPFQGKDQSSHCGMAAANSSRDRVPSPLVSNLAHSCQHITPTLSWIFCCFEVVEKSCLLCLIFGVFSILSVNTCEDPSLRDLEMSSEESKLSRKSKVQNPESEIENPRSQFWWLFLIFCCTQKTGNLDIVYSISGGWGGFD